MPLTSADPPDPTSAPSSPAAPTRGFVHSPYCFPLSATDWADPGTLGVEAPPMMDLGLRIAYTTPALGGIGPLQRRKLLHGDDLFYEASLLDAWSPLPDHSPNRPIRTRGSPKGDPELQGECPHPKPWKRRRAQRGFAFYVCLHCHLEWRVVTPKALRRRPALPV
eukprot:EG_transcript_3901